MPKSKPRYTDPSLTEAQLVVLGVAAPLLAMNDLPVTRFGGYVLGEPSATRQLAGLSMLLPGEAQQRVEQALARGVKDQPAWTLGRAAAWASFAHAARVFDAPTAWGYMLKAARAVQKVHAGWEDFAATYAAARVAWRGDSGERKGYEAKLFARLLKDPDSPWARARFQTSLAKAPSPPVVPTRSLRVDDSRALQAALASVQPGDQLVLGAGQYTGPFELETSITLTAARAGRAVLTGGLRVDDAGLLLDGLVLRDGGLVLRSGAVAHVQRCKVEGGRVGIVASGEDTHLFATDVRVEKPTEYGVIVDTEAHAWLERVRVRGGKHSAVSIESRATAHLHDVNIGNAGEAGIQVHAARATVAGGAVVASGIAALLVRAKGRVRMTSTRLSRSSQSLVAVREGSELEFEDSTLSRATLAGIDVGDAGSRAVARNCRIEDVRGSGVFVAQGTASLASCVVSNAQDDLVTVREGGRVSVSGCELSGARLAGLSVQAEARAHVRSSTIRGVDRGVVVEPGARAGLHEVSVHAQETSVTVLGALAMLDTRLVGGARLQLEVPGGRVTAVRSHLVETVDISVATAGDARVSLHECTLQGGELPILAEDQSQVRAHHTELLDFTLAAVSAQPGEVHLERCVVRGQGNGVEAVGGRVVLRDTQVDVTETAASAEESGRIEVYGGSIAAGSGVTFEADSGGTVRVTGTKAKPGDQGLTSGDVAITPTPKGGKKGGAKPVRPAPLPFGLSLWEDRFSVFVGDPGRFLAPCAKVLQEHEDANGHGLAWLVERVAAAEKLEGVDTDPEADSCTILAADYDVLRQVLTSLSQAVRDPEHLEQLLPKKR